MYKLIVFDWDGTLMDSEARIVACLGAAIQDLGLAPRDHAALRNIIGLGLRESVDSLFPGISEKLRLEFVDRYRYHFISANETHSELFPGAIDTLQQLEAQGYFLAVATGKGRNGLDRVLDTTGLGKLFHSTRCADETRSKPHPQMLQEIMDELGLYPKEVLMVGDTEYDLQMAINARVDAIGVTYGVHEPERLQALDPVAMIDRIDQLPGLIHQFRITNQSE